MKNQGVAAAGAFSVGLYLSADATIAVTDTRVGARSMGSLGAGISDNGTTSVSVPTTMTPGTYYLGACADYDNQQAESDEANNCRAGGTLVVGQADLVMTAVSTTAGSVPVGSSFPLSDTVKNQGIATVGTFSVGLYLSVDAITTVADTRIGNRFVGSLGAGASSSDTTTVTLPTTLAPGTYTIGAIADYDDQQAETNKTNNALAGNTITVSAKPVITSLAPTSGPVGTPVTIAGSNFGASQGTSTVSFNGTIATVSSWSATTIVAPVPTGASTGPVVVTVGGVASNGVPFTMVERLAGTVSSASDGTAISGASVEALQSGVVKASTTTGSDGAYSITGIASGTYDVRASASGYETDLRLGISLPAGGTATVNFSLTAPSAANTITFLYDELGRLTGVMDPTGDTVTYKYDAAGNLLSISHPSATLAAIIEFTPNSGPVGTSVTIDGAGFSPTASQDTVKFNGIAATVTSATATQIVTTVPSGAVTGPIIVTTPAGSAMSSAPFIVK